MSVFFQNENDNKNENILYDRLLYMNLLDENKAKKDFMSIKEKINEIKGYRKDLEIILRDFIDFWYCSHPEDIEKLNKMIFNLKNSKLNYFDKNCKTDYDNYKKYLNDAKIRENKKKSIFYNELYKDAQNKFKENDQKRLEETEKNFNELKNIFIEKGIYKIDEKLLLLVLKPFRDDEEKLKNEIKTLYEIFEIKDFQSFDKVYEEILLISKRGMFFNIAAAINSFIENLKLKQTNLANNIKNIINNLQNKKDIQTIKNCYETLKNLKILDENVKENKYTDILIKFKEQPEALHFLIDTSIEEIRNLQELASENDNNYVTVNDILDMGRCVEFFKHIGIVKDMQNKNDNEIIKLLKENVPNNKDIFVYFNKYVNSYAQIKMLKSSVDKSEVLKYKVQALFNGSTFIISNKKEESFKCNYFENFKDIPQEAKLTKEEIISLRERALLSKKITPDYKYFVDTITEILTISNILRDICMKGYPKVIEIKITLKVKIINKDEKQMKLDDKKEYFIDNKLANNYKEIYENLKSILSLLKEKQIKGYETKPLVRYIYGRQFYLLDNNFNKIDNNTNIIPFLKYVTNDLYKYNVTNFKKQEDGDIIENNINDCEKYLNELFKNNKITLDDIYQKTIITQKNFINKLKGIFVKN